MNWTGCWFVRRSPCCSPTTSGATSTSTRRPARSSVSAAIRSLEDVRAPAFAAGLDELVEAWLADPSVGARGELRHAARLDEGPRVFAQMVKDTKDPQIGDRVKIVWEERDNDQRIFKFQLAK